jgi:hypothetical protein
MHPDNRPDPDAIAAMTAMALERLPLENRRPPGETRQESKGDPARNGAWVPMDCTDDTICPSKSRFAPGHVDR